MTSDLSLDIKDLEVETDKIGVKTLNEIHEKTGNSFIVVSTAATSMVFLGIVYFIVRIALIRKRNRTFGDMRQRVAFEAARQLVQVIIEQESIPAVGHRFVEEIE